MDTNDGLEEKAKTGNILESTRVLSVFYPRGPAVSLGQLIVARGSDAKGGSRLPPSDPPPPIPLSPFFLLAIPSSIFHLSPSLVFYLHYYNTSLLLSLQRFFPLPSLLSHLSPPPIPDSPPFFPTLCTLLRSLNSK